MSGVSKPSQSAGARIVRMAQYRECTSDSRGTCRDRLGSRTVAVGRGEKSSLPLGRDYGNVVISYLVDYLEACGAIRRTQIIRWPLRSRSGSLSKSCFMESAQGKRPGRGFGFCPKMAKRAAEICPSARGAKNPKYRTLCW